MFDCRYVQKIQEDEFYDIYFRPKMLLIILNKLANCISDQLDIDARWDIWRQIILGK